MTKRTIHARDVELCVETFGRTGDPALLLIAGAAASMDWWDTELCARLAAGGRLVVRYDHRDTGQSTAYEAGAPPYTGADLVADAVGVLDALGLREAHLVGISMGGAIAQEVALGHPGRVATLTLLSTSPAVPVDAELPPMAERLRAVFEEPAPDPDWSDREAVIDHLVAAERSFAGTWPWEEERVRALAGRVVDRTRDMAASAHNHWVLDRGPTTRRRLAEVTAPTLVLHGTHDPLFPLGHGEVLATEIPRARLVPLPGVGHQVPPVALWDLVVAEILRHTGAERT
ncbi:alpha/beta fold hydrolase [Streptomyces sp. 4N509B]|uniref:alpha/beta fold hydrolase n=1 Tax=Streptomyces sp. 4N509B TaxID=3457413 RepID=UPI003FD4FF55